MCGSYSAVAARVGSALQQTVGMAHDRPGMAHEIGVGLDQFRLVSRPLERCDDAFGEISDISSIANALKKHTGQQDDYPSAINHTDPEILRGMAKAYLEKLNALGPGARHVINKMPLNFWHLGLISCMFSHPVILHCRRDPLDTCLSCYFQNFTNGQEFSFDLANLAHFHGLYEDMMQHWRRVLPIPFVEFRYEDLVEDPDAIAKRILEFIGLEWEDACGKPHESKRVVETASRWQVRQPVYKTSRNRAANYRPYLATLIDGLAARADKEPA